ncbi:MAG: DUF5011 domain-containing protein [Clostridia bacterium]|nr:DUF5011 domain-containing protein [Clostridia bacterium]
MKKSNVIFVTAFSAVVVLFGIYFLIQLGKNNNANPILVVPEEPLTVSVKDGDDVLLKGIIASDPEDGDLSGQVIVEGLSSFGGDMSRTVTYAVCDSSGNVSKRTRQIFYSDYVPPRFSMEKQIIISSWNDRTVVRQLTAYDGAEGDISGRITIGEHTQTDSYTGLYSAEVEVRTQSGMVEKATVAVLVAPPISRVLPVVTLDSYLTYVELGGNFDADSHLSGVTYNSGNGTGRVSVTGEVDTSTAGDYLIEYTAESSDGNVGRAYLTVCVR